MACRDSLRGYLKDLARRVRPVGIESGYFVQQIGKREETAGHRLAQLLALMVLATSSIVLLGWTFGVRELQSLIPGHVTMKANTALGLAFGACSLLMATYVPSSATSQRGDQSRDGWHAFAARAFAALVLAIGTGTLIQYIWSVNLGIDQFAFSAAQDSHLTATPGRMAAVTAAAFVLLGSALSMVHVQSSRGFRPAQLLLIVTGALALTALLGYLYGVIPTVGLGQGVQIAVTTAFLLILLSVGALALHAESGWVGELLSPHAGGVLARRLLPFAIIVPLVLGGLRALGSWTGQFSVATLSALVAVFTMLAFGVVIWWTAHALNKNDRLRQAAEREQTASQIRQEAMAARADAERRARDTADTARLSAETALREKNEALSLLVAETQERKALEEQLLQSQKMEAIGQLAGGIAHDFNNLLTVIRSYGSLVLRDIPEGGANRDEINEIIAASDRAAALTAQLLAFSRKQVLQLQPVALNDVVHDVDRMLRRLIGEDIELVTRTHDDIHTVYADPGQLEQVLVNLAVNARDAMPNGGRLTIETMNAELSVDDEHRHIGSAAGEYVMLAVSDTGMGIPREVLSKIFDPFFTTKERGKGTGLGLSTVYGIVKQIGGDIWIYSEPGEGTTFKIYLPRFDDELTKNIPVHTPESVAGGTETILLVEDDPALRVLAERILTSYGYAVLVAPSGDEAKTLVEGYRDEIDLVLTDVVMPGIGGRSTAEQLTQLRPGLRVVFMSGYTDDEVVRRGIIDRSTVYLQKPFTPEQLGHKVRETLDAAPRSSMA
jgi:signal transduction histidine kinase/ActR/RegA family two-component response regulator